MIIAAADRGIVLAAAFTFCESNPQAFTAKALASRAWGEGPLTLGAAEQACLPECVEWLLGAYHAGTNVEPEVVEATETFLDRYGL